MGIGCTGFIGWPTGKGSGCIMGMGCIVLNGWPVGKGCPWGNGCPVGKGWGCIMGIGCTGFIGWPTGKGCRCKGGTGFGVTGGAIPVPDEICAEAFTTTKAETIANASSIRICLLSLISINITRNACERYGVFCYHDGRRRKAVHLPQSRLTFALLKHSRL
jgi:hypothetical protein